MASHIVFGYKGKEYKAPIAAFERRLNRFVLPDGTLLQVKGDWLLSNPPGPEAVEEVPHSHGACTPAQIAEIMNAVVATEE